MDGLYVDGLKVNDGLQDGTLVDGELVVGVEVAGCIVPVGETVMGEPVTQGSDKHTKGRLSPMVPVAKP